MNVDGDDECREHVRPMLCGHVRNVAVSTACVCVWKKALASTCLVDMCEMVHHMEYTMYRGHDRNVAAIGRLVYVGIGAFCSVDTVENCTR